MGVKEEVRPIKAKGSKIGRKNKRFISMNDPGR